MILLHLIAIATILIMLYIIHTYAFQIGTVLQVIAYVLSVTVATVLTWPFWIREVIQSRKIRRMIEKQEALVGSGRFDESEYYN